MIIWKLYALLYDMYTSFQASYYEKKTRYPILSSTQFSELILVIDTSKLNDSATSSVDICLEIETSENWKGVSAYYRLLTHDRIVEYIERICPYLEKWENSCKNIPRII